MTKILMLIAVAALGYLGYTQYTAKTESVQKGVYSLASVEQRPIPKRELLLLWKDIALNKCENAKEDHNLTPGECRQKVNERSETCVSNADASVPDMVHTKELAKKTGHAYLECVTPYYFCKGKEAKTEEEVRRFCS